MRDVCITHMHAHARTRMHAHALTSPSSLGVHIRGGFHARGTLGQVYVCVCVCMCVYVCVCVFVRAREGERESTGARVFGVWALGCWV